MIQCKRYTIFTKMWIPKFPMDGGLKVRDASNTEIVWIDDNHDFKLVLFGGFSSHEFVSINNRDHYYFDWTQSHHMNPSVSCIGGIGRLRASEALDSIEPMPASLSTGISML
mmetsp:Transcript_22117/g.41798  ORF Transcript_22117/g.41798 Transcript_22117/m.41798 type:complete len:112 (-) Transcript_22117:1576-1911(-)